MSILVEIAAVMVTILAIATTNSTIFYNEDEDAGLISLTASDVDIATNAQILSYSTTSSDEALVTASVISVGVQGKLQS